MQVTSRVEKGNARRQFSVYGCNLTAEVDLGAYLNSGGTGRMNLALSAVTEGVEMPVLSQRNSLFTSHGRNIALYTDRELADSVQGQPWRFVVEGVVSFYWVGGSTDIRYLCQEACTDELLAFWAIHIFLPLFFTLEAVYVFIHACAVRIEDETVLFTGPSHGGKSTLTDYFLQQGHMLVSDDKVATYRHDDTFYAVPSHPNHRPYRKFEDLGLRVEAFSPDPRPVDAIYLLRSAEPEAAIRIERVDGHRGFTSLLPSSLFSFRHLQASRLQYLGELLNRTPLYRVDVPWDLDRLQAVYDSIRHSSL